MFPYLPAVTARAHGIGISSLSPPARTFGVRLGSKQREFGQHELLCDQDDGPIQICRLLVLCG